MTTPLAANPDPASGSPWGLPRLGWAYAAVVTTLAALATFTGATTAYLILYAITCRPAWLHRGDRSRFDV
jgi:hypothetical protein